MDLGNIANCREGLVGLDSVQDVINGFATVVAASCFLVSLELFLVNEWIAPMQQVDSLDFLIAVVNDFDVVTEGVLDGVHPMGVDNARCNFEFCVVWFRST